MSILKIMYCKRKYLLLYVSYKQKNEKMECKDVHKEILEFKDSNFKSGRSEDTKNHIQTCTECKRYSEFIEANLIYIETEKAVQVSSDFDEILLGKLGTKKKTVKMPRIILSTLTAAAMIMFGIFTGLNIGSSFSSDKGYEYAELPSEYYYSNDLQLESIESFFITNDKSNEED